MSKIVGYFPIYQPPEKLWLGLGLGLGLLGLGLEIGLLGLLGLTLTLIALIALTLIFLGLINRKVPIVDPLIYLRHCSKLYTKILTRDYSRVASPAFALAQVYNGAS